LEKDIEAYLVKQVKKRGGLAFKFVSPAHRGVPDRVLIMPGGVVIFVEVKAETGRLSALQNQTISEMRAVGARVCVVWSRSDVDELMGTL
jgi:G:T-mismatch repair DNA endonuclease (very short patch repair protein)